MVGIIVKCLILLFGYFLWSFRTETPVSQSCQEYTSYATEIHFPLSEGNLKLPYMRPPIGCRTFQSPEVEEVIAKFNHKMKDRDLFRLFENTFPNTLDTTILWFNANNEEPRTFISTGDIHAEWLRDSARQLSVYQKFISKDSNLKLLVKGAILQQAEFIQIAPYCNAFHPPKESNVTRIPSSIDNVNPMPPWDQVYECKWELDSLASFFTLLNEYIDNSKDFEILQNKNVINAITIIIRIIYRQSVPTHNENGDPMPLFYSFQRWTNVGTETLPLAGAGNPVNFDTNLVRSAFRPSDDACIYQFLVPSNMQLVVEIKKLIPFLEKTINNTPLTHSVTNSLRDVVEKIERGIEKHAIITHPKYGKVFAYEVDGYGGVNIMDDANLPSLLSIPDIGYRSKSDDVYQNTRKMILSNDGNPYFFKGKHFQGVGGPHVGLGNAWPMSLLLQIRTSDNDDEILELLELLKKTTAGLGLMHESVNVNSLHGKQFTRPWFAWCNSEFGKTILDLADRKPYLIFD